MKNTFCILFALLAMACSDEVAEEIPVIKETPENSGTFIDSRDGKEYKWIKIGNQIWMAENLAYLPRVNNLQNNNENLADYYVYGYNGSSVKEAKKTLNYITYGVLYDWAAAKEASPAGWHLPSDAEWKQLETELGMSTVDADDRISSYARGINLGNQLKSSNGWSGTETGTNTFGFNALPGGYRFSNGNFYYSEKIGYWWTSTESYEGFAWGRGLNCNSSGISRESNFKENGFSIRCIKDK